MKLREIAYARSGDKGNVSNICVFPYNEAHWDLLKRELTTERVREHFAVLAHGEVTRFEFLGLKGLNFVLTDALGGGVSMSLRTDIHGKAFASLLLELEIDNELVAAADSAVS
jgi:hypothetical protein